MIVKISAGLTRADYAKIAKHSFEALYHIKQIHFIAEEKLCDHTSDELGELLGRLLIFKDSLDHTSEYKKHFKSAGCKPLGNVDLSI